MGRALLDLGLGAALLGAGLGLLRLASAHAAPAPSPGGTEPPTPAAAPVETPLDSEPPRELGPRWDDDRARPLRAAEVASYDLSASLDDATHTVAGKGTIHWINRTSAPTGELWFHLYLNAFKNERTLFLRSPFGGSRGGERTKEWGFIDVKRLVAKELGTADLWPGRDRHSPDDPDDETDIRVPLPHAVEPGAELTLDVEWTSRLPDIVARTGQSQGFYMVAQWFPKLARREPDGTWVHFPFHPHSEFYADYGRYSVTLDVPQAMIVGATGKRTSERIESGRRIVRHEIDSVHDFAWTAWERFREKAEAIDGVQVRLLYPPGHETNAERTLEALRFALPHMSRAYGRYPYPVLTVVHPPSHAEEAGGMEYPTLITSGGPWWISRVVRGVEAVTVHELGHQWFYGLVGSDEHRWPFLDEGLNSWAEERALGERYGAGSLFDVLGLRIADGSFRRAFAVQYGQDDVVARPAADFASFRSLGALVYGRTATILDTLGNVYGKEALARAMGRYVRSNRFAHPGPKHLVAAIREVMGDEAADALERGLFERGWVDYVVRSIDSTPDKPVAGIFDRAGGRETVAAPEDAPEATFTGRVLVFRHGTLRFPVDVDLLAGDGSRVRKRWDGRGAWTSIPFEGRAPLVGAIVDPERRVTLDENLFDNSLAAKPTGMTRLRERALWRAELLLGAFGP